MSHPPNAFSLFATTCDATRSTPSKLEKTATLATYLRSLSREDVGTAARFLAAQPFPPSSSRSLGVGGALVVSAIREIASIDRAQLHHAFSEHGEIGEAISPFWPEPTSPPLSLPDVQSTFSDIANTGTQETKRQLLLSLLRRCSNREAVYLLKIILGDMRTGVSEGIIEAAIAQAFDTQLPALRKARLLVGDLDAVAQLAADGALDKAQFRPFVPLGYMLAQPIMTAHEISTTLAGRPAIAEDKYDGIRAQLHLAQNPFCCSRRQLLARRTLLPRLRHRHPLLLRHHRPRPRLRPTYAAIFCPRRRNRPSPTPPRPLLHHPPLLLPPKTPRP